MMRRRLIGRIPSNQQQSDAEQSSVIQLLDENEMKDLYACYNRMKAFSEQIPTELNFNLNRILEDYAERPLQFDLLPKNVMHILDKRIQRMLKNKKIKRNWSSQDTQILCWTVSHYFHLNNIDVIEQAKNQDWANISNLIPGTTPDSCMFKILGLKRTRLSKKKWTTQQNQLLLQITETAQKKNWRNIAEELYKRNQSSDKIFRNAKQCKEHWVCYLNPELKKGSWSLQQDKKLMNYIQENNGQRKWAQIARKFGGRTQNALKNRYTLIMERLSRERNQRDEMVLVKHYLKDLEERQEIQRKRKQLKEQKKLQYQKIRQQKFSQSAKTVQKAEQKKEEIKTQKNNQKQQMITERKEKKSPEKNDHQKQKKIQLTANNIQLYGVGTVPQMNSNIVFGQYFYWVYPIFNNPQGN